MRAELDQMNVSKTVSAESGHREEVRMNSTIGESTIRQEKVIAQICLTLTFYVFCFFPVYKTPYRSASILYLFI